ncbi:hypothetical protein EsDP_00007028 [Epichloe bromicola]|uniref:Uncharacterized protein n=1 Tax=Epichloe bromicola TaxID=79588 RepID=A0ABQ0CZD1_9HYPO
MVKTLPIPKPATFSTSTSQRPYYDLRTLVQTQGERALDDGIDGIDPGNEHRASNSVENEGKLNDLVERIKSNEFFKPIWGELYGRSWTMHPFLYTGCSAEIVDKHSRREGFGNHMEYVKGANYCRAQRLIEMARPGAKVRSAQQPHLPASIQARPHWAELKRYLVDLVLQDVLPPLVLNFILWGYSLPIWTVGVEGSPRFTDRTGQSQMGSDPSPSPSPY